VVRAPPLLLLLAALCGCSARVAGPVELGPAVLFVRAPGGPLAAAGLVHADGSEQRPFGTIAEALRSAPAGALLRLDAGIYEEHLLITRAVVLLGKGPGRTRILGSAGGAAQRPLVEVGAADHVELRGLALERGSVGVLLSAGAGVRLDDVGLRQFSEAAIVGQDAHLTVRGVEVLDVGHGQDARGIELTSGTLDAVSLVMRGAGRRALILRGTRASLTDLDVAGSRVSAVQAVDGADVRVVRGHFEHLGGAALYAGGARLLVQGATITGNEYGVIGFRGAEVTVNDSELIDHLVAAVALVRSRGTVRRCHIWRGGSEGGISITHGSGPIALLDNRIQDPGPMGLHITESEVSARGNTITGARLDAQKDLGDAIFAIGSDVKVDQNTLRGNAGSGVVMLGSELRLSGNGLLDNGRAGLLLLNRSKAVARGNLFARNGAGVQVAETSRASLAQNRFGFNPHFDIDVVCGNGGGGTVSIEGGNTFAGEAMREHVCP
jgi:hypothetical protein